MHQRYKWANKLAVLKFTLTPKQRIFKSSLKLVIFILLPIIIILLPENFFDSGESICLSQIIFNQECYACGLTRACKHLIHFNFEQAFAYNMGSFLILPILSILWIIWFFQERKKLKYLVASLK
ncbi:MAG: DUF2752 domain-containing protein [Sediminibacterium sp.]|nr:DUF2752 domain-containing protein [Sediminibacterium sp.]